MNTIQMTYFYTLFYFSMRSGDLEEIKWSESGGQLNIHLTHQTHQLQNKEHKEKNSFMIHTPNVVQ